MLFRSVGEQGTGPAHEAMEAAHAANGFVAGAQVEVIGVSEDDLCVKGLEGVLGYGLDRAGGADGHEDGSLDGLMRQMKLAAAAAGSGFRKNLELEAHQRILSGRVRAVGGSSQNARIEICGFPPLNRKTIQGRGTLARRLPGLGSLFPTSQNRDLHPMDEDLSMGWRLTRCYTFTGELVY